MQDPVNSPIAQPFDPRFEVEQARVTKNLIKRIATEFKREFKDEIDSYKYARVYVFLTLVASRDRYIWQTMYTYPLTPFANDGDAGHVFRSYLPYMDKKRERRLYNKLERLAQNAKDILHRYKSGLWQVEMQVDANDILLSISGYNWRPIRIARNKLESLLERIDYSALPTSCADEDRCALNLVFCLLTRRQLFADLIRTGCAENGLITIDGVNYIGAYPYFERYFGGMYIDPFAPKAIKGMGYDGDQEDYMTRKWLPNGSTYAYQLPYDEIVADLLVLDAIRLKSMHRGAKVVLVYSNKVHYPIEEKLNYYEYDGTTRVEKKEGCEYLHLL